MAQKRRIVFMGTPDFAVPTLAALVHSGHEVILVVTQPDRPRGRGRKLTFSSVKTAALELGLAVAQPETVNVGEFAARLEQLAPDYLVVVAYGQMLSKRVLGIPARGAFNVHASLLPRYRGAAPIQWAIINGEQETGVTTMFMDAGMDTGDILDRAVTHIGASDTASDLHDRLATIGARLLVDTIEGFETGRLQPVPQDHRLATYASMLSKEDGHIDWTRKATEIDCLIRGVTPWPGAYTFLEKRRIKIFRASPKDGPASGTPGTIQESFPGELVVATGDGRLSIHELQADSGRRMAAREFLAGCRLSVGERMT